MPSTEINPTTMFKLSYGLFVLTARDGAKDNGCIINTATQLTSSPLLVSIAVNKENYTRDMLMRTGEFNLSVLTVSALFGVFERFGFHSGKDTDKFAGYGDEPRTANGIRYLTASVNGVISARVTDTHDCGTHILFISEVTGASVLSAEPSMTYQYYFDNIKPKPRLPKEHRSGFICKICAHIYESDTLPSDYICPVCKHGAPDFEKIKPDISI